MRRIFYGLLLLNEVFIKLVRELKAKFVIDFKIIELSNFYCEFI